MILTPTHLAIVMEYASGGELFERISNAGRFNEDEVFNLLVVELFAYSSAKFVGLHNLFLHRLASFSSSLYLESATVTPW